MDRKELLAERRKLLKQIAKLERALKSHHEHLAMRLADPTYRIGKYVSDLGASAIGPCMIIEDREIRDILRAAVKRTFPSDAILCHRCDTPECAAVEHLFPGTHQDNMRDCALKGRWSRKVGIRKEKLGECKVQLTAVELLLGISPGAGSRGEVG